MWHVLWQICMCAAMAANKYSPRRGPEMDEKRANEKGLSEERFESSPEVDKTLYKHTIIIIVAYNVKTAERIHTKFYLCAVRLGAHHIY